MWGGVCVCGGDGMGACLVEIRKQYEITVAKNIDRINR